jgi:hypothetical protein
LRKLEDLPLVLTIEEAAEVLRISRWAAYEQARIWRESGGRHGFTGQINSAESKVQRCREDLEELHAERSRRIDGDAEHGWPDERLRTVDGELHALTPPARDLARDRPTHRLTARLIPRTNGSIESPRSLALHSPARTWE